MASSYKFYSHKFIGIKLGVLLLAFLLPCFGYSQTNGANQPSFNHAALCAHDLKKTAAFYSTVLQLQTIHHPFNETLHVWFKIGPGLALHIIQGNCPQVVDGIGVHLCFKVASLETFIHHLNDLNVSYGNWTGEKGKIQVRTDGVKQIYFKDPDGSWIEVNDDK